jgi:hypothetical protein
VNRSFSRWLAGPLLVLGLGLAPSSARANDLRKELGKFADEIKKLVVGQGKDSIDVGEFTGPATPVTSAGPGIQQIIIEELKARGITVKKSDLYVKGEYLIVEDDSDKTRDRIILRLLTLVRDKRGKVLLNLDADIKSNLDIIKTIGVQTYLPPKADTGDRNERLGKHKDKPPVAYDGKRIKTREDSPYCVEIRVAKVARKPALKDGYPFISMAKGECYEIYIENKSDYDAAVSVTIDGLDMFTFSELRNPKTKRPLYTHWIIPKGKATTIVGWHKNNKKSNLFEVTGFGDSEAAKLLKSSARVGTITVCFHAAWTGDNTPPDEKGARSADDLGTKRGPEVGKVVKTVQRKIGVLREAISVRYGKGY